MIVYLEGILRESHPLFAVVVTGGVGYGVHIPLRTAEKLPPVGQEVQLYTRHVLREDASELFGFLESRERDFFDLLTKVSGIGPRTALNLLSRVATDTLESAISSGDTRLLSQCPGIGKKTAERLVVELRDKLITLQQSGSSSAETTGGTAESANSNVSVKSEAIAALTTLGFKFGDAEKAVNQALQSGSGKDISTEELVRLALKPKA